MHDYGFNARFCARGGVIRDDSFRSVLYPSPVVMDTAIFGEVFLAWRFEEIKLVVCMDTMLSLTGMKFQSVWRRNKRVQALTHMNRERVLFW